MPSNIQKKAILQILEQRFYIFSGQNLQQLDRIKDLGVTIDSVLFFLDHINSLIKIEKKSWFDYVNK